MCVSNFNLFLFKKYLYYVVLIKQCMYTICYMSQHVLYYKQRRRHFYVICHNMYYIVNNGEDISKLNDNWSFCCFITIQYVLMKRFIFLMCGYSHNIYLFD